MTINQLNNLEVQLYTSSTNAKTLRNEQTFLSLTQAYIRATAALSCYLVISSNLFIQELSRALSCYLGARKTQHKVLLVQAQASGQILHEEELAFMEDPGILEVALMANLSHYGSDALAVVHNHDNVTNNMINQAVQMMPSSEQSNVVTHSETEITSDSNIIPYSQYVIESQQAAVQNSNSSAQQDALILSVIEQLKTQVVNCTKINLENKSVNDTLTAELERYKEQVKVLKEGQNVDLKSKDNISDSCAQSVEIDHLKQTLSEHLKEKESLMQTVTLLKNDFKKEESRNIDREIALEKRIKQLDNIVFKRDQSAQTVHMLTKPQFFYDHTTKQALGFQNPFYLKKAQQLEPKLYDGNVIKSTSAIVIPDSEETLMLAEKSRSKMLLKQQDLMVLEKKVNTTPVDYVNSMNSLDPSPSYRPTKVGVPKELPKVSMVNTSLKKLKHHLAGFDVVVKERTMVTAIIEGSWGPKCLSSNGTGCRTTSFRVKKIEVKMNQVLNENERLLEQVINKDIVNIVVHYSVDNAYVNVNECKKRLKLETELLNKKDFIEKESYGKLFRSYTTLEKHCISFEVDTQFNQEIFQRDNSVSNQRVKPSTSASGSQPSGNTKKDKIRQTPSSTQKNKVEAHPRKVKSSLKIKIGVIQRLGHSLFFVGKFCDSNLEVAFRQHACFIRNLERVDLLTGSRGNNLYTLSLRDMMASLSISLCQRPQILSPGYGTDDILFQLLFDKLLTPLPSVDLPSPEVIALIDEVVALVLAVSTNSPSSTTVDQDAPSLNNSQTTPET
ncbi:hypothetical protein Tco_0747660 [Tanacetum coccineum]|uniref:Integrase, catalytic region, zinc finger, CCHC-type, peptidase aspartic, catalytic n=1 Tax=Tanacetum coccineum TaxID=301880 RepID=A0ABQ4YTF8_9ASTR